ncbi:MAG: restriction endonuclease [Oscillospiraceae bacterium]|nr:restriction endonuclease [Oscillospiraceae bacterium]
MKESLTLESLIISSKEFCEHESSINHVALIGVTDGKAVGTYVEHRFKDYLLSKYAVEIGNSAKGIDLPGEQIQTDIKVTSITQPQSSCPYESARQKVFGLGYNLLIFVYEKHDLPTTCNLNFLHCTFVDKERTSDFTITKRLREMVSDGANKEDIMSYLQDRNIPGDEITLSMLADEILQCPPKQGYLTISNALQWRLQYSRVISLNNSTEGIINYDR